MHGTNTSRRAVYRPVLLARHTGGKPWRNARYESAENGTCLGETLKGQQNKILNVSLTSHIALGVYIGCLHWVFRYCPGDRTGVHGGPASFGHISRRVHDRDEARVQNVRRGEEGFEGGCNPPRVVCDWAMMRL